MYIFYYCNKFNLITKQLHIQVEKIKNSSLYLWFKSSYIKQNTILLINLLNWIELDTKYIEAFDNKAFQKV